MITFENLVVPSPEQWTATIRGMRNPKNSWESSDSGLKWLDTDFDFSDVASDREWRLGKKDRELMLKLAKAGSAHAKFKRTINVTVDITSNHIWWAEFDTYLHTVRNSCSKMHKIHVKPFSRDDFSHEGIDEVECWTTFDYVISKLEQLRNLYNTTNEKKYWRAMLELLPMGYNIRATVQINYETLTAIYRWRRGHKMFEWCEFCDWIETLPYSEIITDCVLHPSVPEVTVAETVLDWKKKYGADDWDKFTEWFAERFGYLLKDGGEDGNKEN